MAITAAQIYLLNKMNATAANVQLGTLISNAESVVASEIALANGKVFVGNGSDVAAAVSLSGDVTIDNAGAATIANLAVTNAKVSASAAIAFSKLAALSSAQFLVGNGSNVATAVAMSGDASLSNAGAVSVNTVTGTTTNDNAAAGKVGEYVESLVAVGSAVSLSTGTAATITSISLTAGDWQVSGCLAFNPAASTSITVSSAAVSKTTNAVPAIIGQVASGEILIQSASAAQVPANDYCVSVPKIRVSLASTTTIFLVAKATFSVSTLKGYGSLFARRIR